MMNTNNPLISIVVPAYNYGRFLDDCIQSVLSQTYTHWELLIVDNASTDNTQEIIAKYNDPRIRTFKIETNEGPVKAWKLAYNHCRGDYFALLPADDVFLPTKLEKQVEYLHAHPNIDGVGTYIEEIDDEGNTPSEINWIVAYTNQYIDFADLKNWRWTHYLCIPTAIYSKKLCDQANAIPCDGLNNICDWDFHIKLLTAGAKFAVIPEVLTRYRWHTSNTTKIRHDSNSQWIFSFLKSALPMLRTRPDETSSEIKMYFKALYAAKTESYFVEDVPKERRCANLEAFLDLENAPHQFENYRAFLEYSDKWEAISENQAVLEALDETIMDLRSRLLKRKTILPETPMNTTFPLERSYLDAQRKINDMEGSLSWRITHPLRMIDRLLQKVLQLFVKKP